MSTRETRSLTGATRSCYGAADFLGSGKDIDGFQLGFINQAIGKSKHKCNFLAPKAVLTRRHMRLYVQKVLLV